MQKILFALLAIVSINIQAMEQKIIKSVGPSDTITYTKGTNTASKYHDTYSASEPVYSSKNIDRYNINFHIYSSEQAKRIFEQLEAEYTAQIVKNK